MIIYKEYIEKGVEFSVLQAELMPLEVFHDAHQSLVLFCHDIFVMYREGILLVKRTNEPARNIWWPLGGRVLRGVGVNESARKKVKEESGLELTDIRLMGMCRTYFHSDPFGHGHGTDTVNAVFFGRGDGILELDQLHEKPLIVKPSDCTVEFMNHLEPYVRDYLKAAMELVIS